MDRADPLFSHACLPLPAPKTTNDLPLALPESLSQLVAIVTVKFNLPKVPPSCYILHIEGILPKHSYVPKRITSLLLTSISTSQKNKTKQNNTLTRLGYSLGGTNVFSLGGED